MISKRAGSAPLLSDRQNAREDHHLDYESATVERKQQAVRVKPEPVVRGGGSGDREADHRPEGDLRSSAGSGLDPQLGRISASRHRPEREQGADPQGDSNLVQKADRNCDALSIAGLSRA